MAGMSRLGLMLLSGVPSTGVGACALPSAGSWNGRGIFYGSNAGDHLRAKKLAHMSSLVAKVDFLGYQETHASHASALNYTKQYLHSHWIGWSASDSSSAYCSHYDSMDLNNDQVFNSLAGGETSSQSSSADSSDDTINSGSCPT